MNESELHVSFPLLGHQFMTSYTIHILTQTATCGGVNHLYSYSNISKVCVHAV